MYASIDPLSRNEQSILKKPCDYRWSLLRTYLEANSEVKMKFN